MPGASVSLSEQEVHWRDSLNGPLARGLSGVRLIVSDARAGLAAARRAVLGSVCWQRCQFHLQQNALSLVMRQEQKAPLAASLRAVFNAGKARKVETLLAKLANEQRKNNLKLADWLGKDAPESLTIFFLPEPHRRLLRTTNGLKRIDQEIKRRTRVARLLPNKAYCLRLVTAVLIRLTKRADSAMIGAIKANGGFYASAGQTDKQFCGREK